MESGIRTTRLSIDGMTCVSCQNKIERMLNRLSGVEKAQVSYSTGVVVITYRTDKTSIKEIADSIEKLDYKVNKNGERKKPNSKRMVGLLTIIISFYIILERFGILNLLVPNQLADTKMGYGMLFVIGLITSVHCVAMCGGINLSQCIPKQSGTCEKQGSFAAFKAALFYNLGRVISYTLVGFILGLLGLFIGGGSSAGVSTILQGILKLTAGVFMVIMGINMLGIFQSFRKLQPRMPKAFSKKIGQEKIKNSSPLIVGLLNGLMPCGPLQSMQIIALASANPFVGAFSMFLFSLGTVPLMLGLGTIVSALGQKFTKRVMSVGAVLVVVLGLAMISQGVSLSGVLPPNLLLPVIIVFFAVGMVSNISFSNPSHKEKLKHASVILSFLLLISWNRLDLFFSNSSTDLNEVKIINGQQVVTSTLEPGRYPNISVEAGMPVKWIVDAPQGTVNGCNNRIFIKDYDIEYSFTTGENIIEFTPKESGIVRYSCWMGMIRGNITVTESEQLK